MAKVVLAGGTGNLGNLLIPIFRERGDDILVLTRHKMVKHHPSVDYLVWNGRTMDDWVEEIEGAEVLINLCGASINCRFTPENKQRLLDSRLEPTRVLGEAIQQMARPPRLWVNLSGVSIFSGASALQDEFGTDYSASFLGDLARQWEGACEQVELSQTRKVILRVSPVLSKNSGMFKELLPLVRMGLGGKVGSGQQLVSWIHEDDFAGLVAWLIGQEQPSSLLHACSPFPVSNREFMEAFCEAVGRKFALPLPGFAARLGAYFKGVDPALLLDSVPVTTILAPENGYKFKYPYIQPALKNLM